MMRQGESEAVAEQATSKIAPHKRSAEEIIEGASGRQHTFRSAQRRNRAASCVDTSDCGHGLAVAAAEVTAEGVGQSSSTVPPPVASRPPLSFSSSMLRVIAENQAGEVDSFHPWHECPGPYGGRLGGLERQVAEVRCPDVAAPPKTDMEELSSWTAQPFFSATAPASFTAAVSAELDATNDPTRCRASCPAGLMA
jgi:hypothetical protein